jgi:hypothetical protein
MAALLAADHARLGEGQSAHVHHYRRIKGEDQAAVSWMFTEGDPWARKDVAVAGETEAKAHQNVQ